LESVAGKRHYWRPAGLYLKIKWGIVMKKFFLGAVLVAFAGPAITADMPVKAPPLAVNMAYN
jgi:hypothetical protein